MSYRVRFARVSSPQIGIRRGDAGDISSRKRIFLSPISLGRVTDPGGSGHAFEPRVLSMRVRASAVAFARDACLRL